MTLPVKVAFNPNTTNQPRTSEKLCDQCLFCSHFTTPLVIQVSFSQLLSSARNANYVFVSSQKNWNIYCLITKKRNGSSLMVSVQKIMSNWLRWYRETREQTPLHMISFYLCYYQSYDLHNNTAHDNPFPDKPLFLPVCSTSLLKT